MANKQVKGAITFNNNQLALDSMSAEKVAVIEDLNNFGRNPIILTNWSSEDIFLGKDRLAANIDYFELSLVDSPNYVFKSGLARFSRYTIGFDAIKGQELFSAEYFEGKLTLDGEIKFQIRVKEIVYEDFVNSGLVIFIKCGIRVGREILSFGKYGKDWELEKRDETMISKGDTKYFEERPVVSLKV